MAAKLLRKLSQSALTSAGELDLSCTGDGQYKKLLAEEELVEDHDQRAAQYSDILGTAGGAHPANKCSGGTMMMMRMKKKKKKKVPKGYIPVLVVGNMDEEDDGDMSGGGDGGGRCRCTCHVPIGCGCRCSWQVYVIRVCVLGHPLLGDLLRRSCQQFGYSEYAGALRLPCDPHTFETLLTLITS